MPGTQSSRIRFACDCGRKFVSPAQNAGKRLHCHHCGQDLIVPEKSTVTGESDDRLVTPIEFDEPAAHSVAIIASLIFAVVLTGTAFFWQGSLDGPQFMIFYTFAFTLCFLVAAMAGAPLRGKKLPAFPGVVSGVVFVGIAVLRLVDALQRGMHNFGALTVMALLGGVLIVATAFLLAMDKPRPHIDPGTAWKLWSVAGLIVLAGGFVLRGICLPLGKVAQKLIETPEDIPFAIAILFLGAGFCFTSPAFRAWFASDGQGSSTDTSDDHPRGGCGGGGEAGCGGCSG